MIPSRTISISILLLLIIVEVSFSPIVPTHANKSPTIVRLDPRLDRIVPVDAALEKIAEGLVWAEGPLWNRSGNYLLFSDVPNNRILKWKAGEGTSIFLKPSGYSGKEPFTGPEPGTNRLSYAQKGQLVC